MSLWDACLDQQTCNCVRVHVGRRSSVFQVAVALQLHWQRNSDRSTAISNSRPACQSLQIQFNITMNPCNMPCCHAALTILKRPGSHRSYRSVLQFTIQISCKCLAGCACNTFWMHVMLRQTSALPSASCIQPSIMIKHGQKEPRVSPQKASRSRAKSRSSKSFDAHGMSSAKVSPLTVHELPASH